MKRNLFRANIVRLAGYVPGLQPGEQKVIKLNTNENPYPPSPRVFAALRGALDDKLKLYPSPTADGLRQKGSEVYGFRPEEVLVGNGSDELLSMVFRAFVGADDVVTYPWPSYSLFEVLAGIQGAQVCPIEYHADYSLPEELFSNHAKLTLVVNPNSPSGTFVSGEELYRLAGSLSGVLVIDEAYVDFAEEDCLSLARECENVIVLRTLSKSFSLAGLRIGLAFAPEELIGGLLKVKDSYNVNCLSAVAGEAALLDLAHMRTNVAKITTTRTRLVQALQELGLEVYPSQSNFVLVRISGASAADVYEELEKRGILVRYFNQPRLRDSLRITVGTDAETDALLRELKASIPET